MLFLRNQSQGQGEDGGQRRTKINDKELKGNCRRANTKGTLISIFICGSLILSLGIVVLLVGLLAPIPMQDPTPWLVIGPTCIVMGILVLLLSVEIIIKLRKESESSCDESDSPVKKRKKISLESNVEDTTDKAKSSGKPKSTYVIIHPEKPLKPQDIAV